MDEFCEHLERLAAWVSGLARVPVTFVEPGYKQDLETLPQPLIEIYLVTEGAMRIVVRKKSELLRTGDMALANAHFGNHGEGPAGSYRYGCISLAVPYGPEHAAWTREPFLITRKARNPEGVHERYQEVADAYHGPRDEFREFLLKASLLRLFAAAAESKGRQDGRIRNPHVLRAIEVMTCRRSDTELSVSDIARRVGVTTNHLVRVFRTSLATTPGRYLTEMRIRDAQSLLLHSSFSIKEVAAMLGFKDQLYFSRVFRQRVGVSPKAFRLGGPASGRRARAAANR